MSKTTPSLIIRLFHRWSGLLLILLIGLKILSGYGLIDFVHVTVWVDIPLIFFFVFHASYGILKILMPRIKRKWQAFFITNLIGLIIFLLFIFTVFLT